MKKIFVIFLIIIFPLESYSQSFTLKINSHQLKYDSLFLQIFDGIREYNNVLSAPYNSQVTFKQKKSLPTGVYQVCGDEEPLFTLLISEEKDENYIVNINADKSVQFENSDENNKYIAFNQQIARYDYEADSLQNVFNKARQTIPQYMLQRIADSLLPKVEAVIANADAYKLRISAENKGTILASIANFSREVPSAPRTYYQNKNLVLQYFTDNLFKYLHFEDARMCTYPGVSSKMLEWCKMLTEMEKGDANKAIDKLLNKAQKNPEVYNCIFDNIEKVFGTISSPFWVEEYYLTMLNNALNYNELNSNRRSRFQTLYELYSKNQTGQVVPNFEIMWPDGSKSTLHDIECEYMILYFQNPDCPTCTEIREKLSQNEDLNKAIDNDKIKLVTIYFEKDEELWRRYLGNKANPQYLHGWNYDYQIETQQLYDLRVIPFMFLLDKDKKVIKKDILENEISNYLRRLNLL